MIQFGPGSLFLMVTPMIETVFVFKFIHKMNNPPNVDSPAEDIEADLDITLNLQEKYPSLTVFDFQQITEMMIEHIIGWDTEM
jgi:hypothetical protein